ncbi:MAG: hypothetical protein V3T17_02060 [Pseudomonadales bacterium]
MLLLQLMLASLLAIAVTGCGGGGSSSSAGNADPVVEGGVTSVGGFPILDSTPVNNQAMLSCKTVATIPVNSTITGLIRYQRVPHFATGTEGLDYDNTVNLPVRGVVVQAVEAMGNSCSETVVTTGLTNANGEYGLNVPVNLSVCVQVRAQLYRDSASGGANWDIQLVDNTNNNAPYYLVDNTIATPSTQPQRDLLAGSGAALGSSDYTSARAAAPFAILDTLCEAIDTVVTVDNSVQFPKLVVNWSENNLTAEGEVEDGEIGSAFYRQLQLVEANNNITILGHEIFLLGDEDNDTDEYDPHVITHEFAHFIIGSLSRHDAAGGAHTVGDRLDMRLAFDEGWADAFSAIALNSASSIISKPNIYHDSFGNNQDRSFRFAVDSNNTAVSGWYSESSVFSVIYNLFDAANDGVIDSLSLGFAPIYTVITSAAYKNSEALLSIYSFIHYLKNQSSDDVAIDSLMASENFQEIIDAFGSNEDASDNDVGGDEDVGVVYYDLELNTDITVCSNNQYDQSGDGNKLSVSQFITFNALANRLYRFDIQPVSGDFNNGQGSLSIYKRGLLVTTADATGRGDLLSHAVILSGLNIIALTDVNNATVGGVNPGRRCFTVGVD